ncbi:LamG domain-containing protein [Candidatus Pacearchaeota archaeon]|nr:LamG domain-containing protein [Candidatus Pacearchaeota archaeon]
MKNILAILLILISFIGFSQNEDSSLRSDIINYCRFERTSGNIIDEKQVNDGTNTGATRGQTGIRGNAFSYDGSSDKGQLNSNMTVGSDFTWNIWFKTNDSSGDDKYIVGDRNDVNNNWCYFDLSSTGIANFVMRGNTLVFVSGSSDLRDNNWHMLTGTFVSSGAIELFIDGVSVDTDPGAAIDWSSIPVGFGQDVTQNPATRYFNGLIDEFIAYSRVLSQLEIDQLYQQGNALLYVENFKIDKNYEKFINYILGNMYFGWISTN